jgi:hypothetical protein
MNFTPSQDLLNHAVALELAKVDPTNFPPLPTIYDPELIALLKLRPGDIGFFKKDRREMGGDIHAYAAVSKIVAQSTFSCYDSEHLSVCTAFVRCLL